MTPSDRPYLVIDLEATCDDAPTWQRAESEIIEIGAVLVDRATLTLGAEFQAFVRPVRHPQLTPFCTRLTSITQAEVDAAAGFPEVIQQLGRFLAEHCPDQRPLFASWGAYDKNQLDHDAAYHGVRLPLGRDHLNLKQAFSERLRTKQRYGMAAALTRAGLPLEGTHHRGIDDARNIARLLPFCLGRVPMP